MGQVGERGGSWINNPRNCRSAYRNYNTPDNANNNIGFRVVCGAPSTLLSQSWQVGICWECAEESRPVPAMACLSGHPKIKPGQLSLVEVPRTVRWPTTLPMANYTLHRRPATAQYFTEPLLKLDPSAIPLDMVLVPGGTFMMGSPEDELERENNEGPQYEVTVPSFFMGRYPVTQAQWRLAAALPQVERELKPDPARFKGENRPVEQVSWYDAVEFCKRLERETGRPYRLPSEAEWEYACRAGTKTPFYFGKTLTTELANYNGTSYADGPEGKSPGETTPVDHFGIANAFGLCDMHGNVYEWCQDTWHGSYEDAPVDGSAWVSEGERGSYVLRGGSWLYNPRLCRSASRFYLTPDNAGHNVGFRVVCGAPRGL